MRDTRQVLAIGELLIDLIASGRASSLLDAETLDVRPGGAPANVAVALARQGVGAGLCAVVGNDQFGDRLIAMLDANRVDGSRVRRSPHSATTLAFAWKDARGDGHFQLLRQADIELTTDDIEAAGIDRLEAIVIGSVALSHQPARSAVERAIEIAAKFGVPICFDVNMRPTIWQSNHAARLACESALLAATLLKLSMDDARFLLQMDDSVSADEVMAALGQFGNRFIVLTDGARGAWFADGSTDVPAVATFVPAFRIEAREPTGAGDAFMASIIARLMDNQWQTLTADDVRFASAAGALTTTRAGAIDSLPTRSDIDAFLSAQAT